MSLISRSTFPKTLYSLFRDISDVRALAKSTSETFIKNANQLSKTINDTINLNGSEPTGYLYTMDGGIYRASDVKNASLRYLEGDGELEDVVALNDNLLSHNCIEILSDSKTVLDSNNCYANAYKCLSDSDTDDDKVSVSDFNALNEACGVAIDSLYGYYDLANLISDSQYSLIDKYLMVTNSLSADSIYSENNRLITEIDVNQYGLCPLAAWGVEFLSKILSIDFSNIANTIVSMVKTAWNAIATFGHAIENFVGYVFNKYVLSGEVFSTNFSANKLNYLNIPIMQFTFDNDIGIFENVKAFSTFSSRCLYSILLNERNTDIGTTVQDQFVNFIAQQNVRFIVLKFGIIGLYHNTETNKVECVIYLIPSDPSRIGDYLAPSVNSIRLGLVTVANTVPFNHIEVNVENSSNGCFIEFAGSAIPESTAHRIFSQSCNEYIHDLLANTNLSNFNEIDDKSLFSGICFSHYKMMVLLNYIANFDLIDSVSDLRFTPTYHLDGSNLVDSIDIFNLPVDYVNQLASYYVSILMLHGTEHEITYNNGAQLTYDYSMNSYSNDWSNEAIKYGITLNSTSDNYSPSVSTLLDYFFNNPIDISSISTQYSSGNPSQLQADFTVFTTSGQATIHDSLGPTFTPSVGNNLVKIRSAICFLMTYIVPDLNITNSVDYPVNWTEFGKRMIIIPSVKSISRIVHPGLSLLTNAQQAARFRGVLLTVGIATAVIAAGIAIGNTIIAFRSSVLAKNFTAQSKYLSLSKLTPGTAAYEAAKAEAISATNSAVRWNSFAAAIGGSGLASSSNLTGLIKNDDQDSKLERIISLISN